MLKQVTAHLLQVGYYLVSDTLDISCRHCLLLESSSQIVSDLEDSFAETQGKEQVVLHYLSVNTSDSGLDIRIQFCVKQSSHSYCDVF